MPIKEETQQNTSRQHPIPQNVMDVEFKVVGDLTVRQLMYLFAGGTFAYLIFRSDLQWFWRYSISFISVVGTVAIAFVPYEERGLDKWVVSFFKAMTMPTQMVWRKTYSPPAYFLSDYANIIKNEIITLTPAKSRNKLDDYLDTLSESQNDLDKFEAERLRSIKMGFSTSLTTNVVLTQRNNNPSLGGSSAPSTYTDVTYIEDQSSPGRIITETSQMLSFQAKPMSTPPINTPSTPQDQNQNAPTPTPTPEPPKPKEPEKPPEPPVQKPEPVVNTTPIIVNIPAPVMQTPPPAPKPAPQPAPMPVNPPMPKANPAPMHTPDPKPAQDQQQQNSQKLQPKPHANQLLDQKKKEEREKQNQQQPQFAAHRKPEENKQDYGQHHMNIPAHMNRQNEPKPKPQEPPKPAMLPEPNLPHAHRAPERPKNHDEPRPEPVQVPTPQTQPIQVVIVPTPMMQTPPAPQPAPKPAPMQVNPPEPKMHEPVKQEMPVAPPKPEPKPEAAKPIEQPKPPEPQKPPEPPKQTIQVEIKPVVQPVQQTPPAANNGPTPEQRKEIMKDIHENEMASKREFLTSVELKKHTLEPTAVDRAMVNIPSGPGGEIKIRTSTRLPKIIVVQDIKEIHAREALLAKKVKELLEVTKQVRDGLQNAPDKKMHIEQNKNRIDFFDTKYRELEKERASLTDELKQSKSNVQMIDPAEGKELHQQVETLATKNDDLKEQLAMIQKELSMLKTESSTSRVEDAVKGGADQPAELAKVVKVEKVENRKPDPNNTENANIIAGTVKDKSGALIENAVVIIKDKEGDAIRALKTNQLGRFRTQTPMQNGQYNVEVIKGGMKFDIISVEAFGETISPLSIIAYE